MNKPTRRFLSMLLGISSLALIAASCAEGDNLTTAKPVQGAAGTSATGATQTTPTTDTQPATTPTTGQNTNPPTVCGNGVVEFDPATGASEQCDINDLAGSSCEDQGLGGGELSCAADCTYDTTMCDPTAAEPDADLTGGYSDV
jgi:hypothetical protein